MQLDGINRFPYAGNMCERVSVRLDAEPAQKLRTMAREENTTMTAIIRAALWQEWQRVCVEDNKSERGIPKVTSRRKIRGVTSPGGLPPGLDLSDRRKMWE